MSRRNTPQTGAASLDRRQWNRRPRRDTRPRRYRGRIPLPPLPERPIVSVIVPSFNQGRFIGQTLESALEQDYRPIEVIVADGGSTDETLDVLRGFDGVPEVVWLSEPDRGPVDAVNKGLAVARGQVSAIQSSDDFYLPGSFAEAVRALSGEPAPGLVYADVLNVGPEGLPTAAYAIGPYSLMSLLAHNTYVPQASAFFRTEVIDALGGWDERIPYVPDTDLWMRVAFHAPVRKLNRRWACVRNHPEQRNVQTERILRDCARMLDQSPDLARAFWSRRLAARSGASLLEYYYRRDRSDWQRAWSLWKAALLYPPTVLSGTVSKAAMVPGWFTLMRALGRLRRMLKGQR